EPYLELLPHFDLMLVMTIKAGFGGQEFIPELLSKVRAVRAHRDSGHLSLRIEVDGGIAEDTIAAAAEAGADTFVAGTAVFTADDPTEMVRRLRVLAERASTERARTERASTERASTERARTEGASTERSTAGEDAEGEPR